MILTDYYGGFISEKRSKHKNDAVHGGLKYMLDPGRFEELIRQEDGVYVGLLTVFVLDGSTGPLYARGHRVGTVRTTVTVWQVPQRTVNVGT